MQDINRFQTLIIPKIDLISLTLILLTPEMNQEQLGKKVKRIVRLGIDELAEQITDISKRYDIKSQSPIKNSHKASIFKLKRRIYKEGEDSHVAMKVFCKELPTSINVLHEVEILEELNKEEHENIIRMYGAYSKEIDGTKHVVISLELCDETLFSKMPTQSNEKSRGKILSLIESIVNGMYHIHTKSILHLDLKPDNIMVKKGVVKIIDFGESLRKPHMRSQQHLVSQKYCPPEVLEILFRNNSSTIQYRPSYDTWSFGMILHQMLLKTQGKELEQQIDSYSKSAHSKGSNSIINLSADQIIAYGKGLIESWSQKVNHQRNEKQSLFFNILKVIFVDQQERCNFDTIRDLIQEHKRSANRSLTSNKQFAKEITKCFSPTKSEEETHVNPSNLSVMVYLRYLAGRIDILTQLLEHALLPRSPILTLLPKLQKLLFQHSLISLLYQQWSYLISLQSSDSIKLPGGQLKIIRSNQNTSQHFQYKRKILPFFSQMRKKHIYFQKLINPVFPKFKSILQKLGEKDVSIHPNLERQIRGSKTIDEMLTFSRGGNLMSRLLKNVGDLNTMSVDALVVYCKMMVVGRFEGYFAREKYLSLESFEFYSKLRDKSKEELLSFAAEN